MTSFVLLWPHLFLCLVVLPSNDVSYSYYYTFMTIYSTFYPHLIFFIFISPSLSSGVAGARRRPRGISGTHINILILYISSFSTHTTHIIWSTLIVHMYPSLYTPHNLPMPLPYLLPRYYPRRVLPEPFTYNVHNWLVTWRCCFVPSSHPSPPPSRHRLDRPWPGRKTWAYFPGHVTAMVLVVVVLLVVVRCCRGCCWWEDWRGCWRSVVDLSRKLCRLPWPATPLVPVLVLEHRQPQIKITATAATTLLLSTTATIVGCTSRKIKCDRPLRSQIRTGMGCSPTPKPSMLSMLLILTLPISTPPSL